VSETLVAELVGLAVTRLVLTDERAGADADDGAAAVLRAVETVSRLKEQLGSRRPVVRTEYLLDPRSYQALPAFLRMAARVGLQEVSLSGPDLAATIAGDGGARLKETIKLAEAGRVAFGAPVPGPLLELLS
jgi:hypothetical protein